MQGTLLVPNINRPDFSTAKDSVINRNIMHTDNPENMINPCCYQCLINSIATREISHALLLPEIAKIVTMSKRRASCNFRATSGLVEIRGGIQGVIV